MTPNFRSNGLGCGRLFCSGMVSKEKLNDVQLREMKEAFALFDKNKDGFITTQELCTVMNSLRQAATPAAITEMISHVDMDGNGLIDFNEFLNLMQKRRSDKSREANTKALFEALDKDASGYIDSKELKQTLESVNMHVSDREIQYMMTAADNSIPDRIYYEEFEHMMCGKIGRVHRKLSESGVVDVPVFEIEESTSSEEDDTKELRVAFALCDKDGDGNISAREVEQVMKSIHINVPFEEVLSMVQKNDLDGNGLIDFNEFCTLMNSFNAKVQPNSFDDELMQAFKVFDRDKNGFVDSAEIEATMHELGLKLTEKDVQAMMKEVGVPVNGKLNYDDFIKVMKGHLKINQYKNVSNICSKKVAPTNNSPKHKDRRKLLDNRPIQATKATQVKATIHNSTEHEENKLASNESSGSGTSLTPLSYQMLGKRPSNAAPLPLTGVNIAARPELQVAFALFDRNTDGRISFEELKSVMKMFHKDVSDREVMHKFKKFDTNGDGFISFDEMVVMLESDYSEPADLTAELRYLFNKLDRDESGYIDSAELQGALVRYGIPASQPDVNRMLARAGVKPRGHIYFSEFAKMMTNGAMTVSWIDELDPIDRQDFSDDELEDLEESFRLVDTNQDGVLSVDEMYNLLTKLRCTISMVDLLDRINVINTSGGGGTVDFRDFLKMMSHFKSKKSSQKTDEDEMRQAFKVFDIDGNGFIDSEELRVTMGHLGEKLTDADVRSMIREADINGDGKIDYEEFIKMMAARK